MKLSGSWVLIYIQTRANIYVCPPTNFGGQTRTFLTSVYVVRFVLEMVLYVRGE
jgi:hypothetical protein